MTQKNKCVTDEQIGHLTRRTLDFLTRVIKGSIDYDYAMEELQKISEEVLFTFEVNFDSSRWKELVSNSGKNNIAENVIPAHFQNAYSGKFKVTVELVTISKITSYDALLKKYANPDLPDRAITETFFDRYQIKEEGGFIISACGDTIKNNDQRIPRIGRILQEVDGMLCYDLVETSTSVSAGHKYLLVREMYPV